MTTIWKFSLKVVDSQMVEMPRGATLLCVQVQWHVPCLWVQVDSEQPKEKREILTVGTGHLMPEKIGSYLGSYQLENGALIFHVFEGDQ